MPLDLTHEGLNTPNNIRLYLSLAEINLGDELDKRSLRTELRALVGKEALQEAIDGVRGRSSQADAPHPAPIRELRESSAEAADASFDRFR